MENEIEQGIEKKQKSKMEHVALNELSVQKITRWFEQINAKKKVKLSKKDLLNWLIEKLPEGLSTSDLNSITEKFYDEETYLRQLLRDVKRAKASGELESTVEVFVRPKREKREPVPTETKLEE